MTADNAMSLARGWTVPRLAKRFCVSEDKVRRWVKDGTITAVNTAEGRSGRPRFVVTPEALAAFERGRAAATPAAPKPRRRKKTQEIDFYPD